MIHRANDREGKEREGGGKEGKKGGFFGREKKRRGIIKIIIIT
jgi:hypothetical protein